MSKFIPVTVLIADDEPVASAGLRHLLAGIDWMACIGEVADGLTALEAIGRLRPEVIFLDIHMPGLLGTEVVRRLTHQPVVVFTTAHAEHAITAFELGALDYLLKPFGPIRFNAVIDRLRATLGEPVVPALERLGEALGSAPISRIFVRSGRAIVPVAVDTITWFEAVGDYVAVHAGAATHLVHLSLNRLEQRLDPTHFLRIHRTHIVNLDYVKEFKRKEGGTLVAHLQDGSVLAVSRAKAQEIRGLAR